jgi:lipoate-protein ligase A
VIDCRLIIDPPTSGALNMAVDEALLRSAAEDGAATLRFYRWNEPTLSLGYFQRYADRQQHAASRTCAIVRRQTGGGAILHDRELTYSLVLPPSHPLTRQNEQLYQIVHEVFVNSLSPSNERTLQPSHLHIRSEGAGIRSSGEPFLCFERQSKGDVIFIFDGDQQDDAKLSPISARAPGDKILGSAQRRYHGAVLQHGSLLLERSPAAPELEGLNDLAVLNLTTETIISTVVARLSDVLHVRTHEAKLSPEMQSIAAQIANNKYGSPAWTKRR